MNNDASSNKLTITSFFLLTFAFLVYSTTGIFSKLASSQEFLSVPYFGYFALVIVAIGIYALLWQMILKRIPLSRAFLFKSMTVIFSLTFAWLFFHEQITINNIIGGGLIVVGIIVNSFNVTE